MATRPASKSAEDYRKRGRRGRDTSMRVVVLEPLSLQPELCDIVEAAPTRCTNDYSALAYEVIVGDASGGTPASAYTNYLNCARRKVDAVGGVV